MHYLIATTDQGNKLVDYGDEVMRLKEAMLSFLNENLGANSVIMNERMVRDTFLCDEYGIPIKDDGFLIRLDDL
jgi:hypothetical protein